MAESSDEIEERIANLLQYAGVMGAFYKALTDNQIPSPLAGDLTQAWWDSVLAPSLVVREEGE